jgi:hypothetical protein
MLAHDSLPARRAEVRSSAELGDWLIAVTFKQAA